MAKKTGSNHEIKFGKLSIQRIFLKVKIEKAINNNDDNALKKYSYQLKNVDRRLSV